MVDSNCCYILNSSHGKGSIYVTPKWWIATVAWKVVYICDPKIVDSNCCYVLNSSHGKGSIYVTPKWWIATVATS